MKFLYEYRTSDNVRHEGVVAASDREAAFAHLKEKGIRPGRLSEAPGFFNKLIGKGKRWIAISVLAFCLVVFVCAAVRERSAERYASEDRAQVFGDPSVIQRLSRNGWRNEFKDEGESWLARHAIPGKVCDCPDDTRWRKKIAASLMARKEELIAVEKSDAEELKKIKRMVNGMKQEFAAYVDDMPDAVEYVAKSCERCRIEKGVRESFERDISKLAQKIEADEGNQSEIVKEWDKKNATLRSMGLSTIPLPE